MCPSQLSGDCFFPQACMRSAARLSEIDGREARKGVRRVDDLRPCALDRIEGGVGAGAEQPTLIESVERFAEQFGGLNEVEVRMARGRRRPQRAGRVAGFEPAL